MCQQCIGVMEGLMHLDCSISSSSRQLMSPANGLIAVINMSCYLGGDNIQRLSLNEASGVVSQVFCQPRMF